MFAGNDRISSRQAFRLLTYDLLGFGTLMIPTVLAKVAGRDGIFCIFIGLVLSLIYLKLLKRTGEKMKHDFAGFLLDKTGKIPGMLLLAGYLIYFILLAGYIAGLFARLVLSELLKEESFGLVLFLILLLVFYGVSGGIEGRARVYELLFWFIMVPLFFMFFFAAGEVDMDYWIPVFTAGAGEIAAGSYYVFLCFSFLFLTLFLKEYMTEGADIYKSSRSAVLFAGILIGILYLILLGIFGADALATMEFPAVTLMSRVQIVGGFLKRTDAFMFGIWFFTLYALLNSAVFYGEKILGMLWGAREKKERLWILFVVLLLTAAAAGGFYYSNKLCNGYEKFLWYIGTPYVVLVPLLLSGSGKRISKKTGSLLLLFLVSCMFSGCKTAEIEDKSFPVLLTVKDTENFGKSWLNEQESGNRVLDYNHLKVILIEREFLEDVNSMEEMLTILNQQKDIPQNTYVMTTENVEELLALEEELKEPLGNYLEEMLENVTAAKKDAYPTLGLLFQERENHLETLFIPLVGVEEGKPVISGYEVWKRGNAAGSTDTDVAMLSFFIGNQLDRYTLQLEKNNLITLKNIGNEVIFSEQIEKSGVTKRKIQVTVSCDGTVLSRKNTGNGAEDREGLEQQLKEYLETTAGNAMANGIDVVNGYKKVGGYRRDWYDYYRNSPQFFEEDMTVEFVPKINWTNLPEDE